MRNSIRDLRVSRIKSAELLRNTFERPEGFYEQYKKDRFRKLVGEDQIKLVLKFTKEAARYIKEYESNKADRLIEHKSGDLIFEKTTTMTPEIVKWVLGFGKYVIVIEPEVVRRAVIEHAEGILEGYKGIGEGELL